MAVESFLGGKVELHCGDCLELLPTLAENSVDSCVTDPPYHLTSGNMAVDWAAFPSEKDRTNRTGRGHRTGFMGKQWDGVETPKLDAGLGHWLAGFADGEGCFTTRKNGKGYVCEFIIHVRADDAKIIQAIHAATDIGDVRGPADRGDGNAPMIKWIVSRQKDCAKLVQLFRAFPLRAKKARDFEVWASAVEQWITHEPGTSWDDLQSHAEMLSAVKMYGSSFNPSQFFHYRWARQVYRVLKPGGYLLAMGGTRTYHRLAAAIEDAGFEIRDTIMWVYGSGFPKSHDVSKGIDRAAGAEREVVGTKYGLPGYREGTTGDNDVYGDGLANGSAKCSITAPATSAARQWQGWGTALKPAMELICLARKPLSEPTVAANVLRWGTGAINVDECRVYSDGTHGSAASAGRSKGHDKTDGNGIYNGVGGVVMPPHPNGRWPANLIHDGSEEVVAGFPDVDTHGGGTSSTSFWRRNDRRQPIAAGDSGSAARFFYQVKQDASSVAQSLNHKRFWYGSKADSDDRLGAFHPTVKPLDLMQYLVRLVTPPKGTVLDPFAGTGTTGEAAWRESMRTMLIEREAEYQADIRRRMELALSGPDERARQAIKERMKDKPPDHGPLFDRISPDASPPQPIA